MTQKCYNGHDVVYQAFSGGEDWYCEICDETGPYDYYSIPPEERPRAWLLTQPNGIEELKKQMPNVDKTNEQEPTEGPESASGVSSSWDTAAEESTTNRLLELEAKFSDDVRIYPGELGELIVQAFGFHERVSLRSLVNGIVITKEEHVINTVYNAVEDLRRRSNAQRSWYDWLESQGWS